MNPELATKSDIEAVKTDIEAVKTDIEAVKTDIGSVRSEMKDMESRFDGKLDTLEQRLIDQTRHMLHDTETKLLQAFYSFAETNTRRLVQVETTDVMLLSRVSTLESRMLQVEKRLNVPPAS